MYIESRLNTKFYLPFKLLALFSVAVLVSKIFAESFGALILLIVTIWISGASLPGNPTVQKYSAAAVLYIGLSPGYLILRGFFNKGFLTTWDLQIYSFIFLMAVLIWANFSNSSPKVFFNSWDKAKLKIFLSSMFGLLTSLAFFFYLKSQSIGHAVAWVSSGDSKNHFVNGVTLTELGYLNPQTFLIQPSSSPTYLALVLSQFSSGIDQAVLQMSELMSLYAIVWIILVGILGLAFASVTQLVWTRVSPKGEEVPLHLLALSSMLPTFSFILGPALYDGFFTAIFGISAGVAITVWYLELVEEKSFSISSSLLGLLIFFSTITAWMFIIPFTAVVYFIGQRSLIMKSKKYRKLFNGFILLGGIAFIYLVKQSEFVQGLIYQAKLALTASGAVNASSPEFYFSLVALMLLSGQFLSVRKKILGKHFIYLALMQLFALFAFKSFSNLGFFDWNYYLLKYQWIMFSLLVSLIFSCSVIVVYKVFKASKPTYLFSLILVLLLVFVSSESVVPTNRIWEKISSGWENPRSKIVNEVLTEKLDRKNPTMFFHYGYGGDSRLANFWLNAFADPIDPIKGWNYTIDTTGDPQQLCDVNAYYPTVKVVTSDVKLEEDLMRLCGNEKFVIDLRPPII